MNKVFSFAITAFAALTMCLNVPAQDNLQNLYREANACFETKEYEKGVRLFEQIVAQDSTTCTYQAACMADTKKILPLQKEEVG